MSMIVYSIKRDLPNAEEEFIIKDSPTSEINIDYHYVSPGTVVKIYGTYDKIFFHPKDGVEVKAKEELGTNKNDILALLEQRKIQINEACVYLIEDKECLEKTIGRIKDSSQ